MSQPAASATPARRWRAAWVLPLVASGLSSSLAPPLADAGLSAARILSLSFFVGLAGGIAWQVLNRRDMVDRFLGWAVLLTLCMAAAALPEVTVDSDTGSASVVPGILTGIVLAEGWMRQSHRRL